LTSTGQYKPARMASELIGLLAPNQGLVTQIRSSFGKGFKQLAQDGDADVGIMSTEEGFSPLGASGKFFESDLAIPYDSNIRQLAQWNRFENTKVTLIAFKSRRPNGALKGIILAPGSNTKSYEPFAGSPYSRPHRDFYYNVSYEAIAYACFEWSAQKIAMSHLSSCGQFAKDMAICQIEAASHFCNEHPNQSPKSLTYCECCIRDEHFEGIASLETEVGANEHRPIRITTEQIGLANLLHLDWQ